MNKNWSNGKVIGKGSYGVVSIAFRGGETIAVKKAEKRSVESVEALENEIDILRSVSSPYVVKYYGDDETASTRSLYMEYVPGGDVARGGKVDDVALVRSYTWCLVSALAEIHRAQIVHCDVKGSNLLVDPTNKGVLKLADFGSAKRVGSRAGRVGPRGSPLWMAPEAVRGESQGCESDVWALGCVVIEMLTGMPAWRDNGAHTLFKIGYSGELPEYPAHLPELARDFLSKCLVRQPGQRWTCDQLLGHPFVVSPTTTTTTLPLVYVSPRSVLNWDDDDNVNFSDDEGLLVSDRSDDEEASARGRIGNLATVSGVNWESDGWTNVRKMKDEFTDTTSGIIIEVHNYDNNNDITIDDKCIISLSEGSSEVGVGGERCGCGGLISRQTVKREQKITAVTMEFKLLLILMLSLIMLLLLFTLYCSTRVGLPNVAVFVYKINAIHCFWINFVCSSVSSFVFRFCLLFGVNSNIMPLNLLGLNLRGVETSKFENVDFCIVS